MAYSNLGYTDKNQKKRIKDDVEKLVFAQTQNRVVLFGDSIAKQNLIDGNYSARGWFTWLNAILGQPFTLIAVNGRTSGVWGATEGNGGLRSDQILPRIKEQVLDFKPDYAFITPGENDINQGRSAADTFATIKQMYNICLDAGIKVIGSTVTPSGTGQDTDAKRAEYHKLNRMLKEYARTNPGVIMLDMGAAYIQPNLVKPLDNHTVDQTHPSSVGAYKMARVAAETLKYQMVNQPLTLTYNNTDPDNLIGNGNFFGSGGSAPAAGTGVTINAGSVTPDGVVVGVYGSGTTATVSKVPKELFPGEDLLVTINTGVAATNIQVYKEITTGFAVNDSMYAQIAFKFSDDAVITTKIDAGVQERSGTSTVVAQDLALFQESSTPDLAFRPVGIYNGVIVARTPVFKVKETVNRLRVFFNPYMSAGSVRLIGWELRKV